ncbi:MAG: DUF2779 domain-containing protein [Nitrosomonas sp.]|nr:DUF2779 domain-containing protein [Nitrosomonas sp.]
MHTLSKSKLLAFRQCPKRLWLEVHHPELREKSSTTRAGFTAGRQVGDIARQLYDRANKAILIDPQTTGFDTAFTRTQELLQSDQPIFEAGFRTREALTFADVMLPANQDGKPGWRMVEVKSSISIKDYHRDDTAIQAFIARSSGVPLTAIALAHINNSWVYPGQDNYDGLLIENDLTKETFSRYEEVRTWISEAQKITEQINEPEIPTGDQCSSPFSCDFYAYCHSRELQTEHSVHWLPYPGEALKAYIAEHGITELHDIPDELLNTKQLRIKKATLSGQPYFDRQAAAQALAGHQLPAYFMDFETIQFSVPTWKGTRPYQQIPFQFSIHHLSQTGTLEQLSFLDLSGEDPSLAFAEALVTACGKHGPIFVYNAGFEKARVRELAERFPHLAESLLTLNTRVVDLLPVVRKYYYHPSQRGSWSIKAVLPTLCPDLNYGDLDGVQNGSMAMEAFMEMLAPQTTPMRKAEIEQQLLAYCALDTYALVRLWAIFASTTSQA